MGYIRLYPSSRYEYYGEDGIVFDVLSDNRVELIGENAYVFNELLGDKEYIPEKTPEEINRAVSQMMKKGLAYCYEKKTYYEPLRFHNIFEVKGMFDIAPWFETIYIEASKECNQNCIYCDINKLLEPCNSCAKWNRNKRNCNSERLLETISSLLNIPAKRVVILGGDPLQNWNYVCAAIKIIRDKQKDIPVCIHLTDLDLTNEIKDLLADMKVDINIIMTKTCDNTKIKESANDLKERKINVKYTFMGKHDSIHEIQSMLNDINIEHSIVEVIDYEKRSHTLMEYEERKKLPVDETFIDRKGDRCLYRKIGLSLSGDVIICPAWKQELINVNDKDIEEVFYDGYIDEFWKKTRENMKGCIKCPMKWMCRDCYCALKQSDELGNGGYYFCGRKSRDDDFS